MTPTPAPSLRSRLLRRLLPVMLGSMLISGGLSYYGAQYYANQVYDRVLVDTLNGLASRLLVRDGRVIFDFPEAAQKIFEWDVDDAAYFRIDSRKRGHIAGQTDLEAANFPSAASGPGHRLWNSNYRQRRIRAAIKIVQLPGIEDDIRVVVAETTNSREIVTREIFLTVLTPQAVLIFLAVLIVWQTMRRAIAPISEAARDLEQRTQHTQELLDDSRIPQEIRPLTAALNSLLDRLHQTLALQRQFVADAAHQLRTPLTALKLHLENALIAQRIEDIRPMLEQIRIATDRATRLTQQLLTLAESEEQLLRGRRDEFDLSLLLREIQDLWQPRAAQRSITLSLHSESNHESVVLLSHRDLLTQVLDNLIDNALRYCPPGSVIQIMQALPKDGQIQIRVEDNGPGIPISERDQVIRRFYRGDQSPKSNQQMPAGSGLGLAIAHEIMTRLGGTLQISEGAQGQGTRIELMLPVGSPTLS